MPRLIPINWMPECPTGSFKRLVCHWTAGAGSPSPEDLFSYHILIDRRGKVHRGDYSVLDNLSTADGEYAAHVRRLNTGSIAVAACAMAGAKEKPFKPGLYPVTRGQWNNMLLGCADLCERYGITPNPKGLLMHSEVEEVYGVRQNGKWDIDVLVFDRGRWSTVTPGVELRTRVAMLLGSG